MISMKERQNVLVKTYLYFLEVEYNLDESFLRVTNMILTFFLCL